MLLQILYKLFGLLPRRHVIKIKNSDILEKKKKSARIIVGVCWKKKGHEKLYMGFVI